MEFTNDPVDNNGLTGRQIHVFTDCQAAIAAAFGNKLPKNKVDINFSIKESLNKMTTNGNSIQAHWVPDHKEISGNELADKQAKEAAAETKSQGKYFNYTRQEGGCEKWDRKYKLSDKVDYIQEVFTVGKRNCIGEEDCKAFAILNQLLSGHTKLNSHRARVDSSVSKLCSL